MKYIIITNDDLIETKNEKSFLKIINNLYNNNIWFDVKMK
jgi:hypothetical protein